VVEVLFLHAAVRDIHLAEQRGGESEHDAAFGLLMHDRRVHHLPAVDRTHDAMDLELIAFHRHFRHLRDVRVVARHQRDALLLAARRTSQPAFFAAVSSTICQRACLSSMPWRNSYGSALFSYASSSMKLSTVKQFSAWLIE